MVLIHDTHRDEHQSAPEIEPWKDPVLQESLLDIELVDMLVLNFSNKLCAGIEIVSKEHYQAMDI